MQEKSHALSKPPDTTDDLAQGSVQHVAIILDGNRRWAEQNGLPVTAGHVEGVKALKRVVRACHLRAVKFLTVFVFSTENWFRPEFEVDFLFQLFNQTLENELGELEEEGIRLRFLGDLSNLSPTLISQVKAAEKRTDSKTRLNLQIALNYGSRHELLQMVRLIAQKTASGRLKPEEITEEVMQKHLYTYDLPDPDLLIRTGGEQRLSNYLLWQAAYSELIFTPTLWPDFSEQDFENCLIEFKRRTRRFGR